MMLVHVMWHNIARQISSLFTCSGLQGAMFSGEGLCKCRGDRPQRAGRREERSTKKRSNERLRSYLMLRGGGRWCRRSERIGGEGLAEPRTKTEEGQLGRRQVLVASKVEMHVRSFEQGRLKKDMVRVISYQRAQRGVSAAPTCPRAEGSQRWRTGARRRCLSEGGASQSPLRPCMAWQCISHDPFYNNLALG